MFMTVTAKIIHYSVAVFLLTNTQERENVKTKKYCLTISQTVLIKWRIEFKAVWIWN